MSHNINEGKMFCVGKAWHEIGVRVEKEVTAKEAIQLAQLNYNIGLSDVFTLDKKIEGTKATYRQDNNEVLGIVTDKYKIVQNVEAFDFFDNVVGEGKAIYHSAGALGKGERIWLLAKLPDDIYIGKNDKIEKYLCLVNSHDGKSALRMYITPIRVVCQNTLNQSLHNREESISIRHIGNMGSKINEAKRVLNIAIDVYGDFEKQAKLLAEKNLNIENAEAYFKKVLFKDGEDDLSTRKENQYNTVRSLFDRGLGNEQGDIKHTLWTAYNSVVEYVDYYSTIKNVKEDNTNRIKNIVLGSGARMKSKAWNEALALV